MKNLKKTVTANTEELFEMPIQASEFLVLNNTSGDLHITIGNTYDANKSALVPAKCSRVIRNGGILDKVGTLAVMPTASGEVEIECINY